MNQIRVTVALLVVLSFSAPLQPCLAAGPADLPIEEFAFVWPDSGTGYGRALTTFSTAPLPPGAEVDLALLICSTQVDMAPTCEIDIGRLVCGAVSVPWEPATVSWEHPWAVPGRIWASDGEMIWIPAGEVGVAVFDVTGIVQNWLEEPGSNNGIALGCPLGSGTRFADAVELERGGMPVWSPLLRVHFSLDTGDGLQ